MIYSGCQKNVPIFKRFFYNRTRVYAAIPQLRNFEHYYEKRYNRQNLTVHQFHPRDKKGNIIGNSRQFIDNRHGSHAPYRC